MKITSDFLNSIKDTLTERTDRENKVAEIISEALTEHAEELDEISKKTLGSYINKAAAKVGHHRQFQQLSADREKFANSEYHGVKARKRVNGIAVAVGKLTKESTED